MPKYWIVRPEKISDWRFMSLKRQYFINNIQVSEFRREFNLILPGDYPWADPLPSSFPEPKIAIPDNPKYRVDFFVHGSFNFVSNRLRGLLDLPDDAVSWVRCITSTEPGDEPEYWFLHPRSFLRIVDLDQSALRAQDLISAKTGNPFKLVDWVGSIRFIEGVEPASPLFFDQVLGEMYLMITDQLARKLVASECTGVSFLHPLWLDWDHIYLGARGLERRTYNDSLTRVLKVQPIDERVADAGPDRSSSS